MKNRNVAAVWIVFMLSATLPGEETAIEKAAIEKTAIKETASKDTGKRSQAESWKPAPGFVSLFNGQDLTGWCYRAKTPRRSPNIGKVAKDFKGKTESDKDKRYSVKDGILTVLFPNEKDRLTGQLYTVAEFPENFVLKLEFRASVNADSGIFIRKPQLQCRDYLVAGPYKKLKKYKPQKWNAIEVKVKGGVAHCTCNGEVLEAELGLPKTGPIGLEGDRGQMDYRHIQLKKLR